MLFLDFVCLFVCLWNAYGRIVVGVDLVFKVKGAFFPFP